MQQTLANLAIVSTVDSVQYRISCLFSSWIACDKSGTGYGGFVKMHTFVVCKCKRRNKMCSVKSHECVFWLDLVCLLVVFWCIHSNTYFVCRKWIKFNLWQCWNSHFISLTNIYFKKTWSSCFYNLIEREFSLFTLKIFDKEIRFQTEQQFLGFVYIWMSKMR